MPAAGTPAFDDRYERVKLLGEGAFGAAYLVRRKGGNQALQVAKEIRTSHLTDKQKQGVLAESGVLQMMTHSNIIAYIDSFFEGPKMYIIMEYADGGDLAMKIKERKTAGQRFAEREIMFMFVQVALALVHIHSRRVLHRDLKPLNIFLTKQGVVKLGDFGIAKLLDSSMAEAQTTIGTPYYLSPEICNNEGYGLKSDLWSLGVVTYELAVLRVPFGGISLPAVAMQIMGADPDPLPEEFSADLKWIIFRFLEKDPAKRPRLDHVLRVPFVQSYIQVLLSHTLESGAGGCEAIVRRQGTGGGSSSISGGKGGNASTAAPGQQPRSPSPMRRAPGQPEDGQALRRRAAEDEKRRQLEAARSAVASEFLRNREAAAETRRRNMQLQSLDSQTGSSRRSPGRAGGAAMDGEQRKAEVRRQAQEAREVQDAAQRRLLDQARLQYQEDMRLARQRMRSQQAGLVAQEAIAGCSSTVEDREEMKREQHLPSHEDCLTIVDGVVKERIGKCWKQAEEKEYLKALEHARLENEEDRRRLMEKHGKSTGNLATADEIVEAGSSDEVATDGDVDGPCIVLPRRPAPQALPPVPAVEAAPAEAEAAESSNETGKGGVRELFEISIPFTDKLRPKPKLSSDSRPRRARDPSSQSPGSSEAGARSSGPAGRGSPVGQGGLAGQGGRGVGSIRPRATRRGSATLSSAASAADAPVAMAAAPSPPVGMGPAPARPRPGQRVQRASGSPAQWLRGEAGRSGEASQCGSPPGLAASPPRAAMAAGSAVAAHRSAAATLGAVASSDAAPPRAGSPGPPTPRGEGDISQLQDALANALCGVEGRPAFGEAIPEEAVKDALRSARRHVAPASAAGAPASGSVAEDPAGLTLLSDWNDTLGSLSYSQDF